MQSADVLLGKDPTNTHTNINWVVCADFNTCNSLPDLSRSGNDLSAKIADKPGRLALPEVEHPLALVASLNASQANPVLSDMTNGVCVLGVFAYFANIIYYCG